MKNKKPFILLTNDDGYFAPGLLNVIDMVREYGDVLVVAPEKAMSGMSHAITITNPLRASLVKKEENLSIYKVNGTPVDCLKIAIDQLTDKLPDLLISGINHGSNSSISIIYSGTMGAAMEGCLNGIPSIGLSLDSHSFDADFSVVVKHSKPIVEYVLEKGLPPFTALNINFPVCTEEEFKGVRVCRQTKGLWNEDFEKRTDPHGQDYYWMTGAFHNEEPQSTDTDMWAVDNNYAAVVPVMPDFTNYKALSQLEELNKNVNEKN